MITVPSTRQPRGKRPTVRKRPRTTSKKERGERMPLAGYAALLAAYPAVFGTLLAVVAKRGGKSPEKATLGDILLLGVATHKVARLLTKDWVTRPLRAPFTEFKETKGFGEVAEKSRGRGLQRAMGDLVRCPWCMAGWVAGGLGFSYFLAPRLTRIVATIFTIETIADFLHVGYDAAKKLKN